MHVKKNSEEFAIFFYSFLLYVFCFLIFFTSKEREALQSGEKIFILVFHMCLHPCEQRISISINKMHIQSITSHRRMWRKSSSLWGNTFVCSRKWSCKMNQILQFSVLYQFKDVFINFQRINLFLCSRMFLIILQK